MQYTKEEHDKAIRDFGLEPKTEEEIRIEFAVIRKTTTEVLLPLADNAVTPLIERYLSELAKAEATDADESAPDDEWTRLIQDFDATGERKWEANEIVQYYICEAMSQVCYSHGYDGFLMFVDAIKEEVAA